MKKFIFSFIIILLAALLCTTTSFAADTDVNIDAVSIHSEAAILIESKTGKILYSKNAHKRLFPASTTKVMTAILTMENCKLTDTATVSHNAIFSIPVGYSHANLREGEVLTIEQLLNILMIPSANDAAVVLAEHIAGSVEEFSKMMNDKAKKLGCLGTNFVNPNGIHDDNHYSTAYDLSLIGQYALKFPDIMRVAKVRRYTLPTTNKYSKTDRKFNSTDLLVTNESMNEHFYEYATGLKTGYTDKAKSCMIATAKKDGLELVAATLKASSNDRFEDCKTLFEYGFNNYSYSTLNNKNDVIKTTTVSNGTKETKELDIIVKNDIRLLTKKGNSVDSLKPEIDINSELKAPISKNTVVGKISYTVDGITYSSDLIAEHDVHSSSFEVILFRVLLIFLILLIISILLRKTNKPRKRKGSKGGYSNTRKSSKNKRGKHSSKFVELDQDFYYFRHF